MHFLLPIFSAHHEFIRLQPHHKMRGICMTWSIKLNVLSLNYFLGSLQNPFTASAWIVLPIHSPTSSDMKAQKAPSLQHQRYSHCWCHSGVSHQRSPPTALKVPLLHQPTLSLSVTPPRHTKAPVVRCTLSSSTLFPLHF